MIKAFIIGILSITATGITALIGQSATQIVDFTRRTVEFVATCISWRTYKSLQQNESDTSEHIEQIRGKVDKIVGGALMTSGILLLGIGIWKLFFHSPYGNVLRGFWWQYWGWV